VSAGLYYEVGFGAYTQNNATLDLSPSATLPKGVTYTVTDNLGNTFDNETGFNIGTSDGPYSYDTYTFTQVFKIGDTEIGRQVIQVNVTTSFKQLKDSNGTDLDPQAIPSLTLKWPADMSLPITHAITVPAIAFSPGTSLNFSQTITGWNSDFPASGLTYTLSSTNPVKDLSAYSNGNVPLSVYSVNDYPTITQTFYYNGQVVGNRKFVVMISSAGFLNLYAYVPTTWDDGETWYDTDFVDIDAIPATTLLLRKNAGE
jgi:hypothetical protein